MRASRKLTASLLLLLALAAAPPAWPREAPKPATNDFLLRATSKEIGKVLHEHGLELVRTVDAAPDPLGRDLYLVRAPLGSNPGTLLATVAESADEPVWMEEAFLASLPETYPGLQLEQRTRAILGAVQQAASLQPPGGTTFSSWIAPEADRRLAAGTTAQVEIAFQSPPSPDPAAYRLGVAFAEGISPQFEPAVPCGTEGFASFTLASDKPWLRWRFVNAGSSAVNLASLSLTWPKGNGDLRRIWMNGGSTEIYSGNLKPTAATISSGWKTDLSKLPIPPGQTQELVFEFRSAPASNPAEYAITAGFAQGCSARFPAAGVAAVIHALPAFDSKGARWQVTNLGTQPLTLSAMTPGWPQENGRITSLRLGGKDLIDAVVEVPFGTNPDGTQRHVWRAYVEQPAAALLKVDSAAKDYQGEGAVIAVIDSGVDPDHSLLRDSLLPGFDFVRNVSGTASEWSDLDQRTRAILGQRTRAILGGDSVMTLNASTSAVLDEAARGQLDPGQLPPGFGHGTMVAGVIHRVAPRAKILPLKAFTADGQGHLFDVIRAIYYAVDQGVTAINMSFSLETFSPELMRAINYAAGKGITCVASAGNDGREVIVFPSALGNAVGVASTSDAGRLSAFSNFGADLVTIAAPGENVVTTYPGGGWALASGTSFAAPWISGIAAVFADKNDRDSKPDRADYYLTTRALSQALPVSGAPAGAAGFGLADFETAVQRLQRGLIYDLWPRADYAVAVRFAEGCTAHYPPATSGTGCSVEVKSQLGFDSHKMFWSLTNTGASEIKVQSLELQWPADNGHLKEIQLNGVGIQKGPITAPATILDLGKKAVTIAPGGTATLRFEFEITALRS